MADAVIIACHEHNGSMTAAPKNAIQSPREADLINRRPFFIMGTGPGRPGCAGMPLHASYSLESEGWFMLHQPRVLLPQGATFMDDAGNATDTAFRDQQAQAADSLIWYPQRLGQQADVSTAGELRPAWRKVGRPGGLRGREASGHCPGHIRCGPPGAPKSQS